VSSRTVIAVALALVCGLFAAIGINQLRNSPADVPKAKTVSIVVAKERIPRGTKITDNMIRMKEVPEDDNLQGVITDKDAVIGCTARYDLVKEDLVLTSKVSAKGRGGMLSMIPDPDPVTKQGYRSIVIQTPSEAASGGGFFVPGDRVDVLLVVDEKGSDQTGGTVTALLQDVEVAAVGGRMDVPDESKLDTKDVRNVALFVRPSDANKLALAQKEGTLHLTLRGLNDHATAETKVETLRDVRVYVGAALAQTEKKVDEMMQAMRQNMNDALAKAMEQKPKNGVKPDGPPPKPSGPRRIKVLRGAQEGSVDILDESASNGN
jgi:pilus assembly protein CpaB